MSGIMDVAKLSKINQITIPKPVREFLKLNPGDRIVFRKENEMVFVEKA